MVRFQPPPPVLVAALGNLISQVPLKALQLAYRLTGEVQDEDYWRNFGKERSTFIAPSLTVW